MQKNIREKRFRLQIMQDVLSAYFNAPLRVFKKDSHLLVYNLLKKNNSNFLIKNNINNQTEFENFIINLIDNFPGLEQQNITNEQNILKTINGLDIDISKQITKTIFITYSSFYPKLFRKLKHTISFLNYIIFITLYISIKHKKNVEDVHYHKNFVFYTFKCENTIVSIGPYCSKENSEIFIKNIIKIFKIPSHYFELEILNEDYSKIEDNNINKIKNIFLKHFLNFRDIEAVNIVLSQKDIKDISLFAIYIQEQNPSKALLKLDDNSCLQYTNNRYEYKTESITQIESDLSNYKKEYLNNIHKFNIEAFSSIGDNLYDKFIPFNNSNLDNRFKDGILKVLKRLVYADAILFYNYIEHEKKFELLEQDGLSIKEEESVKNALSKINSDNKTRSKSLTQKIIDDYYKNKKIGLLKNAVSNDDMIQPFKNKKVESVLSIPLIYDNKIRGILHFLSFRKKAFDDTNKRFLLQFSDFLSHLMVKSIFLEKQREIISLMNKDNFDIQDQSKDLKRIASLVADIFVSDGALIFLHSRNIKDSATQLEYVYLKASIGFNTFKEQENIPVKENESFLGEKGDKFREEDFLVIRDFDSIQKQDMRYYDLFKSNKIKSFLAIKIIGENNRLEGSIVILDRVNREYNALTKRMLNIVAEEIRLLNKHICKQQEDREKILHEIKQTFISLNKQVKRLDMRLKSNSVSFYNNLTKANLFKNLEDIKLSANTSIDFVHNFFNNTLNYDKAMEEDKNKINRYINNISSTYISIRKLFLQEILSKGILNRTNLNIPSKYKVKLPDFILTKIISNIINNAIKYSEPNSKITISYKLTDRFLNIYIDNIGIKILKEERYRIFEKGKRGQNIVADNDNNKWQKRENENQGLGCYYVKELLTKSNLRGNFIFEELESIDKKYSKNRFILKFPKNFVRGIE